MNTTDKFNVNSQVCTDKNQSERLLALGLKKETADCHYEGRKNKECEWEVAVMGGCYYSRDFPAWSLHRLLSMLPDDAPKIFWILDGASITIEFEDDGSDFFPHKGDIYEGVVDSIEWLIKEGYFNKEYLV